MNFFDNIRELCGTNADIGKVLKIPNLEKYKIISKVGKGAFGEVYKIKSIGMNNNNVHALKIIKLDAQKQEKFEKEKMIYDKFSLKKITNDKHISKTHCAHDNINCYLSIFSAEINNVNYGFIITSYYDADLRTIISNRKPFCQNILDERDNIISYLKWIKELVDIIKYLHSEYVAHGDIKPENILINYKNNSISLTDFDTVCFFNNNTCKVTEISAPYASPILYKSLYKTIDNQIVQISDVWAIAIIILELWFGEEQLRNLLDFEMSHEWYEDIDKNSKLEKLNTKLNNVILNNPYLDTDKKILCDLLLPSVNILKKINLDKCSINDIKIYLDTLSKLDVIDYKEIYITNKYKYFQLKNIYKKPSISKSNTACSKTKTSSTSTSSTSASASTSASTSTSTSSNSTTNLK